MAEVIFYVLAAVTVIPALIMVSTRNVFHAALMLILSLLGVAGLYAMLAADFVFAVQLLVYAGGVMVILLFVVLLSGKPSDWEGKQSNSLAWGAGIFSVMLISVLFTTIYSWSMPVVAAEATTTTARLGDLLLKEMALPFEAISLALVASLVGAVYFSSRKTS